MKRYTSRLGAMMKRDSAEVFVSLFKDPIHAGIVGSLLAGLAILYFWNAQQNWIEEHGDPSPTKQRNIYIAVSGTVLLVGVTISEGLKRMIKTRKRKKYPDRIQRSGEKPITHVDESRK